MIAQPTSHTEGGWSAATSAVELSLVGAFDLQANGRSVPIKSRKGCAILAYLAMSPEGQEPRERLSGLLWSESNEVRARASLRQVLHGLQSDLQTLGLSILALSRKAVTLDRRLLSLDAQVIEEDLRFGTIHGKLLAGGAIPQAFCEDLQGLDPAFDAWLNVQRETMQRRLLAGLERIMGTSASTKVAATAILALDPTHEAACRALMREHAADGDVAASLRVYANLWHLLERDYDSEPSPETKTLVVEIKTERFSDGDRPTGPFGRSRLVEQRVAREADARTTIGVSRFDVSGVPPDLLYAADGLRHEVIASLVRFREWAVTDHDGVATGTSSSARRYLLDGTVRKAGSTLLATLTVKQVSTSRFIWSETFEFMPELWFKLRSRLVSRIAVALNVRLSSRRLGTKWAGEEVSAATYDLWLRGHQLLSSWRLADRERASEMLLRVVREAPEFAPAYGSLVRMHNSEHIVRPGIRRDAARAAQALGFARLGARLDPLNSRAHLGLAWSLAMTGRYGEAEATFRDAIDLNENDTWTRISGAQGLSFCGRHHEAVRHADRALQIDLDPTRASWGYQVGIRYLAGDYEKALDAPARPETSSRTYPAGEARRSAGSAGSTWRGRSCRVSSR